MRQLQKGIDFIGAGDRTRTDTLFWNEGDKMHLELFKDKIAKCRIRLRARNNKILMFSEAYASHRNAMDTAKAINDVFWPFDEPIKDLTKKLDKK